MGNVFKLSSGARTAMIVVGVLSCLLIVGIPLGVYVFWRLGRARIELTSEQFIAVEMFSSTQFAWSDVARLGIFTFAVAGQGVAGAVAREGAGGNEATHLAVKLKSGAEKRVMVSRFERWQDILDEVEQRANLPFEKLETGAIGPKWP